MNRTPNYPSLAEMARLTGKEEALEEYERGHFMRANERLICQAFEEWWAERYEESLAK
jgi:hypothetical protein